MTWLQASASQIVPTHPSTPVTAPGEAALTSRELRHPCSSAAPCTSPLGPAGSDNDRVQCVTWTVSPLKSGTVRSAYPPNQARVGAHCM